jgi:hypothetical protein
MADRTSDVRTVLQVACGGLPIIRNERQTVALEHFVDVPSVCVRFTLQDLNSIQNCPPLTRIETAYPFATSSKKCNW